MRFLVTGAGQIGSQLVHDLLTEGHPVTVLRRSASAAPPRERLTRLVGDAGEPRVLAEAMSGADAVLHCIHAPYDARAWRRELPHREHAVMDAAAERGVPVVFPESVYAWGHGAEDLAEGATPDPCSPLGEVRARLLAAREAHPATTISVVAADLVGPTASPRGSVALATVVRPVARGHRAWVLADPDLPHSLTHIPDLSVAMRHAATHSESLAPQGDAVVHAPTNEAVSLRALAEAVARGADTRARVSGLPKWPLALAGLPVRSLRELANQGYLWHRPMRLRSGVLTMREGLAPTPWAQVVTLANV